MKKLKKIWKRVGAIFALVLVMIPVLAIGVNADTIYDSIEKPAETAGGLLADVTYEEAAAIMQRMTNGDRFVSEFYGQIHTLTEDLRACDYPSLAFTNGMEDIDGDAVLAVSNVYLRNWQSATELLNVGYGLTTWQLVITNKDTNIRERFYGRGNCFVTLRPAAVQGYSDITLFDITGFSPYDRVVFRYSYSQVSGNNTYYSLDSVRLRERGGVERVLDWHYVVDNLSIAFASNVGNTPSYLISALLGFDEEYGSAFAGVNKHWDTPMNTVAGVMAGYDLADDAIEEGIASARPHWYNQGYSDGLNEPDVWWRFFLQLLDAPMVLVGSMLNFEIFGINLFHMFRFLMTCAVIIFIVVIVAILGVKIGGLIT